jgi:Flp pilus assembly pilin Flp
MFGQFLRDDSAQGLLEYALIITIVAIAAIATLIHFGLVSNNSLQTSGNNLS